jgi:MFS family permease
MPSARPSLSERVQADPRHARWLLVNCLVGLFATTFPSTILTIAIRPIAEELHSSPGTISWVTTAPLLAGAAALPILGRLGDLRGHRNLYLFGFAATILFSALTAVSWDAFSLITFRTLSQVGATATIPSTYAMIFRTYPAEQRVRASSLASATLASAAVSGVIIGGPLVDLVGWRAIFVVQAVIALVGLLPALVVLPRDGVRRKESIDYAGAVALAAAAFFVTFGINRLGVWGLRPVVVASLVLAPLAVWALCRIELRAVSPILPLEIMRLRNVQVVSAASFVLGAGWMGNFVMTPLLLQSVMGYSPGVTSLISVPRAAAITASAPVAGRLGGRYGERRLVIWSGVGLVVFLALFAIGAASTTLWLIIICLAATGWAFGHTQPGLLSSIGNSVEPEHFGLAASLQQMANQIGSVIGLGLFTAIAADATTPGPFVVVYLIAGGLSALGVGLGFLMTRSGPRAEHLPDEVSRVLTSDSGAEQAQHVDTRETAAETTAHAALADQDAATGTTQATPGTADRRGDLTVGTEQVETLGGVDRA